MNRNGKRIIFYFGIAVILSGIATILSSPVFFERRIFAEQNEDEILSTTESQLFETTTVEEMDTTVALTTTTETTVTTLAVKEESLPFCQDDPKSTVDL